MKKTLSTLKNPFGKQIIGTRYEAILSIILPILIGVAIISLPLSVIKAESWLLITAIWIFAIIKLIFFSLLYIPVMKKYWDQSNKQKYTQFWSGFLLYAVGLAITMTIFPALASLDWGGIFLFLLAYIALVITAVLAILLYVVLWFIQQFKH